MLKISLEPIFFFLEEKKINVRGPSLDDLDGPIQRTEPSSYFSVLLWGRCYPHKRCQFCGTAWQPWPRQLELNGLLNLHCFLPSFCAVGLKACG